MWRLERVQPPLTTYIHTYIYILYIYQLQSYFQEAYEYLIASQFSLYYLMVVDLLESFILFNLQYTQHSQQVYQINKHRNSMLKYLGMHIIATADFVLFVFC